MKPNQNLDVKTSNSFGDEWKRFDQSLLKKSEAEARFKEYFGIFPWDELPEDPEGVDIGCGSGRWDQFVAPKVKLLHCIDSAQPALNVAKENLKYFKNIDFHLGSLDDGYLEPNSQDFAFSLGVLHHVPDTEKAIKQCVALIKPGAPLLLYLYYSFDNRPWWYKLIWLFSDLIRRFIHRLPPLLKYLATEMISIGIYWPLARLSNILENLGFKVNAIPLSYYRNCGLYTMRTDARDRFGTPLEQRFSKKQILSMCQRSGLENIQFSAFAPFWCVVGRKQKEKFKSAE